MGKIRALVGLDSNLGDRRGYIEKAVEELKRSGAVEVIKVSSLYETEPVGGPPQGKYLDGVAEIRTMLAPRTLMALLKEIEKKVGRTPSDVRWGPREIDLDILLFDDIIIDEPDLKIPHPLLHLRDFMLEPICEIAPNLIHPVLQKSVADILSELKAGQGQ
ncbi:MAG: 2-amino-4-hydroxy-6-hydroxymethyldihydropteridine diphosphokinase [Candidatus Omnitrophota bacterium]|nr:2-amino-4-hydroxy-6-hydroxymethyldihydropteridine diphosphokinase [Candidatus Omnitrophota bacterium]